MRAEAVLPQELRRTSGRYYEKSISILWITVSGVFPGRYFSLMEKTAKKW